MYFIDRYPLYLRQTLDCLFVCRREFLVHRHSDYRYVDGRSVYISPILPEMFVSYHVLSLLE